MIRLTQRFAKTGLTCGLPPEKRETAAHDATAKGQHAPYLVGPESKLPRGNFLRTVETALRHTRQRLRNRPIDTVATDEAGIR